MTHLPWMPVFIGDELAETSHLSAEEFGAYERLRRHYWQHGKLPEDDERLRRITGVEPSRWVTVRDVLAQLFDDGWVHEKLDQARKQAEATHLKRSAAGRKGGRPRLEEKPGNNPGNKPAFMPGNKPGNKPGESIHTQMKNSAYEGEVPTHAHPHAREEIPRAIDNLDAGEWLKKNTDLFPGEPAFDECVSKMVNGDLRWSDINRSAAA